MLDQTREYPRSRPFRISLYLLDAALTVLCIWSIYHFLFIEPNIPFLLVAFVGLILLVVALFTVSRDRIVVGTDYIEMTQYLSTKRFLFSEIEGIAPKSNCTYLRSKSGKVMKISQDFEGWQEITEFLMTRLVK